MVEPQKVSNFAIANGADKDAREQQIRQETSTEATPKGAIAQLVEQRTENPCVPGSIPGGTTQVKIKSLILTELAIFLLVTTGRSHYNSHYLNRYKPR